MSFVESQLRTERSFHLEEKEEKIPYFWRSEYKILQRFLTAEGTHGHEQV